MGMPSDRMTRNAIALLITMGSNTARSWHGVELARAAGVGSAVVYAALTRLERAKLVKGSWETSDAPLSDRSPRRLYELTGEGLRAADAAAIQASERNRPAIANKWHPYPGGHPA
jgi:DNA-binding transcriptional regulator PaaX